MEGRTLSNQIVKAFEEHLRQEEKSAATVEKYMRDVRAFFAFVGEEEITKEITIAYKQMLEAKRYAIRSINSMLASINSLMDFLDWQDCKVKTLRSQREIYCSEDKELTKEEYMRLLAVAQKKEQLWLVLQTICSTGIRISELKYFTVEFVRLGEVSVRCKNKNRTILVPSRLQTLLLNYAAKKRIVSGQIFVTRNGQPLDRSNVWSQMKNLCKKASVNPTKVFPHNLRKLFARTFYGNEKDIAKLADILGHGSIETTRIYIMSTGMEHRKKIEQLGLVV